MQQVSLNSSAPRTLCRSHIARLLGAAALLAAGAASAAASRRRAIDRVMRIRIL